MSLKSIRVDLTGDAVQPITVPSGAKFMYALREPGRYVTMYFLGDVEASSMDMVIYQVHDDGIVKEENVGYIGSTSGIFESKTVVTHLFDVMSI